MPDTDDSVYRREFRAGGDEMQYRAPDEIEDEDGVFEIRLPIASAGEVRNDGDDPLTRGELRGMAQQIEERQIGVFPAHGDDDMIAFGRYSPFERLGDWRAADLQTREEDDPEMLMATARMPDPEELPAATGRYREALAILKEQAKRGIGQDASIGWRDDESFPGGVDLMEASIVGIGADWRTNTGDEAAETVAREAVAAGADPDDLVARVADAVRSDADPENGRPLGPPGDRDRFEDFDECVATLSEDDDVSESDAETICGAWENESKQAADRAEYEVGDEELPYDRDSMSDNSTADDGGTTDEQDASGDGGETETTDRAPADIGEDDIAEFVSETYDGVGADDIIAVMEEAGAEFVGLSPDTVSWFFGDVLDMTAGEISDMLDGDDEQAGEMDDEDEEEDDEEMQDADGETTEQDADDEALAERVADLEQQLSEVRKGGLTSEDVESVDTESEQSADADADGETESDADSDEQRDNNGDSESAGITISDL